MDFYGGEEGLGIGGVTRGALIRGYVSAFSSMYAANSNLVYLKSCYV